MKKKVAILIVNYNGRAFLPRCLDSIYSNVERAVEVVVYIVDNKSTDGSPEWIKENYPQVQLIMSATNSGFAGGNNLGWQHIASTDVEYIFLLNQDAHISDGCLTTLIEEMEERPKVATLQPKILLYPATEKINSLGNIIHFLGFGYASHEGERMATTYAISQPINYSSGAAVMIRRQALEQLGYLFDDFMFMYLEDLDFGWRAWLRGWENYVIPESVVYHQYEFDRSIKKIYYFERNRLWIIFKNYRAATLILLMPALLFMEVGQIFFAVKNKTLRDKLRGYRWLLSRKARHQFRIDRHELQQTRVRSDREMLLQFKGRIDFQPLDNFLLRYVANPILDVYLKFLRIVVRW